MRNFNINVHLIGYYNKPNQDIEEETEDQESAKELAGLLKVSINSLVKNKDVDPVFVSVLKGNTVLILKDEDDNLYAYCLYRNIAKVTGVKYNKRYITRIPYSYSSRFIPGEAIILRDKKRTTHYEEHYTVTTSGCDFLLTRGGKTLPLEWDNDCRITIKELTKLVNDKWVYLEEFDTNVGCEDCSGWDYEDCDYSRCKHDCEHCGGRKDACNNSCFYYRYDTALKVKVDGNLISSDLESLFDYFELIKSGKEHNDLFSEKYNQIYAAYNRCVLLKNYLWVPDVVSEYINDVDYCDDLVSSRGQIDYDSLLNIYVEGRTCMTVSKYDVQFVKHKHHFFWKSYHVETSNRTYDVTNDSLVNIDYKLIFNNDNERVLFENRLNISQNLSTIYLKQNGDEYYVRRFS
jgi:hypothetical protein